MPEQPVAAVRLVVPAGAQYEGEDEDGLAHLVEHVVFELTRTPEMASAFDAVQDAGGELNAFTGPEEVVVEAEMPPELVETGLGLIRDCLLGVRFEEEHVEGEREVLLRELAVDSVEDGRNLTHALWEELLGHHPSTRDPLGDPAVVESIDVARMESFFRDHYGAEGLTLVLAGDVTMGHARRVARSTLGQLPREPGPPPVEPARGADGPLRFEDVEGLDELVLGYRTDGAASRDYHAHWFIREYLFDELYESLRQSHHLYDLAAELATRRHVGLLYVHARAVSTDHESLLERIEEAFRGLAEGDVLDAARWDRLSARLVNQTRRIGETAADTADHLVDLANLYGLGEEVPDDLLALAGLTAEDVRAAAQRCVVEERRVEAWTTTRRESFGVRWRHWALTAVLLLVVVVGLETWHRHRVAELEARLDRCEARGE